MNGGSELMIRVLGKKFTHRDLLSQDLEECFDFGAAQMGHELVGFSRALAVWKRVAGTRAFRGVAIESNPRLASSRIVGFGARVFVACHFVDSEIENPRPGIHARLIARCAGDQPIVLTEPMIRRANTDGGIDMVMIGGWRPDALRGGDAALAHSLTALRFAEDHAGYWVNRLLAEVTNQEERQWRMGEGVWRVLSNFESFYSENPNSPWNPGRSLVICTRDEALSVTGHSCITVFQHRRPELRLRNGDQRFLETALDGLTDDELARKLNITCASVKKRWLSLFTRVSAIRPELFPGSALPDQPTRGRQKRHLLLAFLRSHPEELRPYEWC
jgi:hypothetical protein